MRSTVKGTANLYIEKIISFLIKFLDMQFTFSNVLGFHQLFLHIVANHELLTLQEGTFLYSLMPKLLFKHKYSSK
jgi:hypothetical protein